MDARVCAHALRARMVDAGSVGLRGGVFSGLRTPLPGGGGWVGEGLVRSGCQAQRALTAGAAGS